MNEQDAKRKLQEPNNCYNLLVSSLKFIIHLLSMRFLCRVPRRGYSITTKRPIQPSINRGSHIRVDQANISGQQMSPAPLPSSSKVKHDSKANKFTLDLGGNREARIEYRPLGRNRIEMFHTEVPKELRGQGIGRQLAKGALELLADDSGVPIKVKLTCSYLILHLDKFADDRLKKLIVN